MFASILLVLPFARPWTQEPAAEPAEVTPANEQELTLEELDARFSWRTGAISLGQGMAKVHLPDGYRFLEPADAKLVLEDLWGNPPGDTWGLIFPPDSGPFDEEGWAVVLSYDEDGHVSDDDAQEIDYDELLEDMQSEARDANEERVKAGYGSLEVLGWAARPRYDTAAHRLFWAKELQFEGNPGSTLNYDVRALSRKGVLSMNAVASVAQLSEVEQGMQALLGTIEFTAGNRYEDFDSNLDEVAAYGIGGLIAGKLALKVGLFKGLLAALVAAKKLVIAGVIGLGVFLRRFFARKKEPESAH